MKNDDDRMSRNTSNHVPKFVAEIRRRRKRKRKHDFKRKIAIFDKSSFPIQEEFFGDSNVYLFIESRSIDLNDKKQDWGQGKRPFRT